MTTPNEKLETRARDIRARAAIRAWEMRQHAHARGIWFEIERLFALTSRAWVLTEADVRTLIDMDATLTTWGFGSIHLAAFS